MNIVHVQKAASATVFLWVIVAAISIAAAQPGDQKTAGEISVYLGVLLAAMVQGHPKGHAEQAMHEGVPRGRDAYHVMAATSSRTLESMQIAGTVTYGNYFTIQPNESYRILISITRDGETKPITLEFTHEHRTR
jgi:hypothetical protein